MPRFGVTQRFAFPLADVFGFFRRPANLVRVAPPDYRLRVIEAPEELAIGSRVSVEATRWGFTRRIVNEVVELVEGKLIVEEQREGPLPSWRHVQRFIVEDDLVALTVEIDFQTPGGLVGLVVTPRAIEAELQHAYAYRESKVRELLAAGDGRSGWKA
jgi:ligand-binding SRPBCC domain-containing protein